MTKTTICQQFKNCVNSEMETLLYDSSSKNRCYWAFGWLWCACVEPSYKITTTTITGTRWTYCCCYRITDSMAVENMNDVKQMQSCGNVCLSMCVCFPCIQDQADIKIIGTDPSHKDGWRLQRIHKSTEVFKTLTRLLQTVHKDTRQQAVDVSRKMEHVKAG